MRIAYAGHPNSPNAWYRVIGPVEALCAARGYEGRRLVPEAGRFHSELVRGADVLYVHRFASPEVVKAAQYAREHGIAVVWDNDDDLRAVPRGDPAYRLYGGTRASSIHAAVKRMVGLADAVTTPSEALAELYRELGAADVHVIENHVSDDALATPPSRASSRRNGDGTDLLVGWVAGLEHRVDVAQLPIGRVLGELLDAHPRLRVTTIGAWLGIHHERYQHQDGVLYMDMAAATARFDVGIAPIADIPLNRARSNVKLKEYASVGVPWLASPIGPYAGLGEEQGGRLVADDRWREELERLLGSGRDRRKLAKRALRWAKAETMSANVERWDTVLGAAAQRACDRVATGPTPQAPRADAAPGAAGARRAAGRRR
jgi:glycosyltransferase involved in cell wall biosynthesis